MIRGLTLAVVSVLLLWASCPLHAQQHPPIVLGQSCALSGPAKDLGLEMRAGLLAAFSRINDNGGVHGRPIRLISKDDGYEPDKALFNTRQLIVDDQVFLLIGAVGTPTTKAVIPIIEAYQVPLFAPFTGAELLRAPFHPYIINVRASYAQEMERLADYLIDQKGITRIACFYQNDSYGFAGLEGIEAALAARGLQLVSTGSYERNTIAVMGAVREIFAAEPEAVILVGAYAACAEFIKLGKNKYDDQLIFGNISFVGTKSLHNALGAYGRGVIVSQVVPHPEDTSIALVREYRADMDAYQHDQPLSFTSMEGYIAGRLFAEIGEAVAGQLTREGFIHTLETMGNMDIGGVALSFGPDDHQGMDDIYLTRIYPRIETLEQ
jgi:branched-chain amino acid transport system substrate-binding protein